jgi:NAD(P)H-hydrate epimerase
MAIEALSLEAFKKMDYYAVEKYGLSIELMMENAGLQLARLIALKASKECKITVGVGNGNNGGSGLAAARRLAAWGYDVYLDLAVVITKKLPSIQLKRGVLFGVTQRLPTKTDIWVDAYLGFSQRLPLSQVFLEKITLANASTAHRISLDIPIGISEERSEPLFKAHQVTTLAAPKKILELLPKGIIVFIADIGIPKAVYTEFDIEMPCFSGQQLLKM